MKKSDQIIADVLKFHADAVEASPEMKEKIDRAISEQEHEIFKKERKRITPMKWNVGKIAAAALGVCLLTGGVCYAGSQMVQYYVSSGSILDRQTDFSSVDSLAEEAGLNVNAVETFANGYSFESAGIENTAAYDENQKLYEFQELSINYGKEGQPSVSVYAEDAAYFTGHPEGLVYDAVRECDGIELRCYTITNKFVPTDDDLTDEDNANMDNPNYNFACGSSEVEIMQSMHVNWTKDGVYYLMLGFDLTISPEEMLDMAEEMIRAE